MSDERLKLAQSYYDVASDLAARGQRLLEVAEMLNCVADQMCEKNISEARKEPDG